MIVLGLLAAAFLGLMALRGVALLLASDSGHPFLFPLQVALPLSLAFGMVATFVLGRVLGLLTLRPLRDYESRRRERRDAPVRPEDRPDVPETPIEY